MSHDLFHHLMGESFGITKRQTDAYKRRALRWLKIVGLMIASAFVVPVAMISLGLLLGPKGYEGLVAAPLAVLSCWALILYWGLRRKATKRSVKKARPSELATQMSQLLEDSRRFLPSGARAPLEAILTTLEELSPVLSELREETPQVKRLRRLLADDLTELIDHYRRLPPRVRTKALPGGESPSLQLVSGMESIHRELLRSQERLLDEDLYSLATKQRYLELKYGPGAVETPAVEHQAGQSRGAPMEERKRE